MNIADGVEEANQVKNRFKIIGVLHNETHTEGAYADFDVSVIVNEVSSNEAEGKIGGSFLSVVSAGVGAKIDQASSQQNTHRLSFKVFITEKDKKN